MTSGRRCAIELDHRRRRHVEAVEREAVAGQRAGVGEVPERAGREVVDDVDAPALGEQPVDERGTDEAGAAGHQGFHRGNATRGSRYAVHRRERARRRCESRPAP